MVEANCDSSVAHSAVPPSPVESAIDNEIKQINHLHKLAHAAVHSILALEHLALCADGSKHARDYLVALQTTVAALPSLPMEHDPFCKDQLVEVADYPPFLKKNGLYFSQGIVWEKQHPVLTRKDFMGAFEIAFYVWKEGAGHLFLGPNNVTDLWHVKKVNPQAMIHLTEKPTELAVRAMQYSSRAGENVLDLFGGSGSTLIAAEQTGRRAFLMELDLPYADVICERFLKFSGVEPVRESDGAKWSSLKKTTEDAAPQEDAA